MAALRALGLALAALVVLLMVLIVWAAAAGYRRAVGYWARHQHARFPRVLLSTTEIAAGDLFLFVAGVHGFTNSIIGGDIFSHGALAVAAPDGELWLAESTQGTEIEPGLVSKPGTSCVPLVAKIMHYVGLVFHAPRRHPLTPTQIQALWTAAQVERPYPTTGQLARALLGRSYGDEARHCFDHVAALVSSSDAVELVVAIGGHICPPMGGKISSGCINSCHAVVELVEPWPGAPADHGAGGEALFAVPSLVICDAAPDVGP